MSMQIPGREFVWQTEFTFTSAVAGQIYLCPEGLDVSEWEVLFVQLDVLQTDAPAAGTFRWNIGTGVDDTIGLAGFATVASPFPDVPLKGGSSVIRASNASSAPLQMFLRWGIEHTVAGTHRVTFQVRVFLKARSSLPAIGGRTRWAVEQALAAFSESGSGPADLLRLAIERRTGSAPSAPGPLLLLTGEGDA